MEELENRVGILEDRVRNLEDRRWNLRNIFQKLTDKLLERNAPTVNPNVAIRMKVVIIILGTFLFFYSFYSFYKKDGDHFNYLSLGLTLIAIWLSLTV